MGWAAGAVGSATRSSFRSEAGSEVGSEAGSEAGPPAPLRVHSLGSMSGRRPRKTGARSLPSGVQEANRTVATNSGRTHVTGLGIFGGSRNGVREVVKSLSCSEIVRNMVSSKPVPTFPA